MIGATLTTFSSHPEMFYIYRVVLNARDHSGASAYCQADCGGALMEILDMEKLTFVRNVLQSIGFICKTFCNLHLNYQASILLKVKIIDITL